MAISADHVTDHRISPSPPNKGKVWIPPVFFLFSFLSFLLFAACVVGLSWFEEHACMQRQSRVRVGAAAQLSVLSCLVSSRRAFPITQLKSNQIKSDQISEKEGRRGITLC